MKVKKKYAAIDIAKYVSALLVVCIHTYPFFELSELLNTYWIQTVCRLAVPFFFVCSGFFFFRKWDAENPEVNRVNLRKYEWRLLKIYGIWTLVYLPYTIYDYVHANFRFYHIFSYLRDLIFNGSYYHLWFLPALMLATFIVSRLYQSKGLKHTLLTAGVLYGIGYLLNVYALVWQSMPFVSFFFSFFTKILVTSRDGIFFGPMFVGLGLMLSKTKRMRHGIAMAGWAASFVLLILEVTLYRRFGILRDLTSMCLMLVPATYFMVGTLLTSPMPYKDQYVNYRYESLLIYTSHILFAKVFLALFSHAHIVVYFLTLAFAQGFATLVVRLRNQYPILNNLL